MTTHLLARLRYPSGGGRLVMLTWIDPDAEPRRVGALHLGDVCDVMPRPFVIPRRANVPLPPPQVGVGRFVPLSELRTWIDDQPDQKTRAALAAFIAWADAIDTDNDLEAAR